LIFDEKPLSRLAKFGSNIESGFKFVRESPDRQEKMKVIAQKYKTINFSMVG